MQDTAGLAATHHAPRQRTMFSVYRIATVTPSASCTETRNAKAPCRLGTPLMYDVETWKTSGHWEKFRDEMFLIPYGEQLYGLHVAKQDITLTREAVRLAGEDLRVIQARYRAGIATILDVSTSQTALIQAELDLVSARFTYQVARASLEALLGRDL